MLAGMKERKQLPGQFGVRRVRIIVEIRLFCGVGGVQHQELTGRVVAVLKVEGLYGRKMEVCKLKAPRHV